MQSQKREKSDRRNRFIDIYHTHMNRCTKCLIFSVVVLQTPVNVDKAKKIAKPMNAVADKRKSRLAITRVYKRVVQVQKKKQEATI